MAPEPEQLLATTNSEELEDVEDLERVAVIGFYSNNSYTSTTNSRSECFNYPNPTGVTMLTPGAHFMM